MKKQDDNFVMWPVTITLIINVNIINVKYFNFNFKCMAKAFNKSNKLIAVQFNTI